MGLCTSFLQLLDEASYDNYARLWSITEYHEKSFHFLFFPASSAWFPYLVDNPGGLSFSEEERRRSGSGGKGRYKGLTRKRGGRGTAVRIYYMREEQIKRERFP